MTERRKDNILRQAISQVHSEFSRFDTLTSLYQSVLRQALQVTGSNVGFAIELSVGQTGVLHPLIETTVDTRETSSPDTNYPSIWEALKPTITACIVYGVPKVVTNADYSGALEHFPENIKALQSMAVLPLIDDHRIFGAILIGREDVESTTKSVKRLWPLMTTCAYLRRTFLRRQDVEEQPEPETSNLGIQNNTSATPLHEVLFRLEQSSLDAVIELNQNLRVTRFNVAAEKLFGISTDQAMNCEISEFIPETFPNEHRIHTFSTASDRPIVDESPSMVMNLNAKRVGNELFPASIVCFKYRKHGQLHIYVTIRDNSEIQKIKQSQDEETRRFKAVADLAPVGIIQMNKLWECKYVNDRWCDICGLSPDQVYGMGWINAIHQEDVVQTLEELRNSLIIGREFSREFRLQTPFGDTVWVEGNARPMFNSLGDVDGFIATISDVTYHHVTEAKLRNMAEQDALTGLANRSLFQQRLLHAFERLERHDALVVLFLDLDGFKVINDTLGHDVGDLLLRTVADRIRRCVRKEDTVARIGGDEFTILMEDVKNGIVAADIAEKIINELATPVTLDSQEVFVTTSIGIAVARDARVDDAKNVLKQADLALYRAKAAGRNNYQYYSPEMDSETKDRLYLGNSLHRALERNELEVYYQPQADIESNQAIGAEALLRWNHPDRGILGPSEFISLLEETSLINPVGRWLFFDSFRQHKKWLDEGTISPGSLLSINLSPRQLRNKQLIDFIDGAIADTGLSGEHISVEITESVLLDDFKSTQDLFKQVKERGIRIAVDDFGTGYSSLTYLKRFPVDHLKIDRSFVADVLTDPEDEAITRAVIALAKSLNLKVIAEGVENYETLSWLKELGCDWYQGYVLCKPLSAIDFSSFITTTPKATSQISA